MYIEDTVMCGVIYMEDVPFVEFMYLLLEFIYLVY